MVIKKEKKKFLVSVPESLMEKFDEYVDGMYIQSRSQLLTIILNEWVEKAERKKTRKSK